MTNNSTTSPVLQSAAEKAVDILDHWFDPIEAGLRDRVREFIQTMIESELKTALSRPRYARRPKADPENARGRERCHWPRARALLIALTAGDLWSGGDRGAARPGSTPPQARPAEWRSMAPRAYERRTRQADALIAGAYLAGTNTRRVRRALAAVFGGAVGKDTVSRVWRKVKSDWDAWNARSLAEEPIVRLDSRRHRGAGPARPEGHRNRASGRARRA